MPSPPSAPVPLAPVPSAPVPSGPDTPAAAGRIATVLGGAGFLGRHVARRLAREGFRVRVATRRPEEALAVRAYGHVGQVHPAFCNLRDDDSVRAAVRGADAVVNCVGTFDASGRNAFGPVHVAGAGRAARLAAEEGVGSFVHVSAIGADPEGGSLYARSKAGGEAEVARHRPDAVILRPSVMFGAEDRFFNRFAAMAASGPVVPVVGGATRFQPAWVDDVAQAAALGATGGAAPGTYELGGPEALTFRELMERMLAVIQRRRLVLGLPFWAAGAMGALFDLGSTVTGGLVRGPLTRDQVASLRTDNVVAPGARGFADLGIAPAALDAVLPDYLWRFRPSGQYAAIKDSARDLRT